MMAISVSMVTGPLLVVALSVAPAAWAAPIFDLGSNLFCGSLWSLDYCDSSEETKEISANPTGGIAIHNAVVVNVSAVAGTPPGNGTTSNVTANGTPSNQTPSNGMVASMRPSNAAPTSTMPAPSSTMSTPAMG